VTEEVGATTLQQLREQGNQISELSNEVSEVNAKLDQTKILQSKFDFCKYVVRVPNSTLTVSPVTILGAGNWLGLKAATAHREAADYIATNNDNKMINVADVFEQHKYDSLARKWRPYNFVLISNPAIEVTVTFDPEKAAITKGGAWVIDYSVPNVDALGWTYSGDFKSLNTNGSGVSTPLWNSYVRRRKWRHEARASNTSAVIKRCDTAPMHTMVG
jgi:hypothetical protein